MTDTCPDEVAPRGGASSPALLLARAVHPGPTAAVTALVALLSVGRGLSLPRGVDVTAAVFAGQLTIGWGNDLLDVRRDRSAGRTDKPLATGELSPSLAAVCLAGAAAACVVLSFLVGWRSAVVHLGLGVAWGHLYNLGLKSTVWSWVPYAVAFGTLPAVVTLADVPHAWPPGWITGAAAALGVAAHLLNTLPDFATDAATGVRGLPHRLGPRITRVSAALLLLAASVTAVFGATLGLWSWPALALVSALAGVAAVGRGKVPFGAAIAIALVDVVLLAVGA